MSNDLRRTLSQAYHTLDDLVAEAALAPGGVTVVPLPAGEAVALLWALGDARVEAERLWRLLCATGLLGAELGPRAVERVLPRAIPIWGGAHE
ncbi:hypothetical protein [Pararhodospirillum photometricum]|uniref:Uncharacterized protein n=1 Tax=Pararhodospirillum photometricum DSM 122 TaxID=1150469 RepID=H6SQM1_PARPM|nr:hypothetical protein [Pararhodospirillum photometricum]CCG07336.1 unnamed protein product [Pararhodospirillum photometricum DSM 122]